MKFTLVLLLFLSINCRNDKSTADLKASAKNQNTTLNTVSAKDSLTIRDLSGPENESSNNSDSSSNYLKKGASGLKILPVTKITSLQNSEIPADELKNYLQKNNRETDTSLSDGDCIHSNKKIIEGWLRKKRISRNCYDRAGRCIYHFPRSSDITGKLEGYYYIRTDSVKTDSIAFISHGWQCPDYKQFEVFLSEYPTLDYRDIFNYIGDNYGDANSSFSLKPLYWDENQQKYSYFTPAVSVNDSSSLLIHSSEGLEIKYKTFSASKPNEQEKNLILKNLLNGISDISCFSPITIEKLATIDGVSRFVGQILISYGELNSWYIADIQNDSCTITVLEANDALMDTKFYCAYSFGKNNLPDVYVLTANQNRENDLTKLIFYAYRDGWIMSGTQHEFQGDCLKEIDE